ncbi:MAG TPA: hypothetical protein VHE37_05085 [Nevskiaceae bacterium]|nr:hypothetical protein [Nevskiaceae bacterium]
MKHRAALLGLLLPLMQVSLAVAADNNSAEARLREQLRQTAVALRQLQDENGDLKTKLADAEAHAKSAGDDAANAQHALAQEKIRSTDLDRKLGDANSQLAQLQVSYQAATKTISSATAQNDKLTADLGELQGRYGTCVSRNAELVNIGNQLVESYRNKGVWAALLDAEPVTGLHRVELERAAQEFHARIIDSTLPAGSSP